MALGEKGGPGRDLEDQGPHSKMDLPPSPVFLLPLDQPLCAGTGPASHGVFPQHQEPPGPPELRATAALLPVAVQTGGSPGASVGCLCFSGRQKNLVWLEWG